MSTRHAVLAVFCAAILMSMRPVTTFAQMTFGGSSQHITVNGPPVNGDADFKPVVSKAAYMASHPRILIDEGHANYYMRGDRFRPLTALLSADGYGVSGNTKPFTAAVLATADVVIIAGARGGVDDGAGDPAFAPAEIAALVSWVQAGGSLLFAANQGDFARSVQPLAEKLGVTLSTAVLRDSVQFDQARMNRGYIVFSSENHLLGQHPILVGREGTEAIRKVESFTGESLKGPPGSAALLRISPAGYEQRVQSSAEIDSAMAAAVGAAKPNASGMREIRRPAQPPRIAPAGDAQLVAFELGKGRVVASGDAAMFTALIQTNPMNGQTDKLGFGVSNNDDQQFALNVLHWLSRLF